MQWGMRHEVGIQKKKKKKKKKEKEKEKYEKDIGKLW